MKTAIKKELFYIINCSNPPRALEDIAHFLKNTTKYIKQEALNACKLMQIFAEMKIALNMLFIKRKSTLFLNKGQALIFPIHLFQNSILNKNKREKTVQNYL